MSSTTDIFIGDGEMASLMRAKDWAATLSVAPSRQGEGRRYKPFSEQLRISATRDE